MSTRPLDYTQINRCLRLIIRAYSAQAKAPKQLTDQEQIDNLIKKVFQKTVDDGEDFGFFDLLPVRKAKPGDKWWPWRDLIPLRTRREYGLIDPNDPWPHEDEEYFAAMDALDKDEYDYLLDDDEDDDPDEDPPYDDPSYDDNLDDDEFPPLDLPVIPAEVADVEDAPRRAPRRAGIHPSETTTHNHATHPAPSPSPDPSFTPIQAGAPNYWETDSFSSHVDPPDPSPDWPNPNPHPKPRIARDRPPP